ncbi:YutD family protein [Paenibacillus sp. NEAU-GSW1]|uniref:YutD family protein n=1 Tax=Paenibacillus sp. NEAU-GSW1 TaxID=2682486 RepID=UPI0012E2E881|nr:YutD family protein [Paenibacillus sp. NEAU-GSW1]MUT68033.1 DUF1027 domain-containing protein [Paenibacillus sp. NEAU-GSW1]
MIQIDGKIYELLHENRGGWNMEAFRDRYSEVLERYDYIIGDWGYSQLRLKGFFRDNHMKATKESAFSSLTDYINEYCNFGCAYFVLEKTGSVKRSPEEEEREDEELLQDLDDKLPEGEESLISAIAAGVAEAATATAAAAPSKPHVSKGARDRDRERERDRDRDREGQPASASGGNQPQQARGPRSEHNRRSFRPGGGDRNKRPVKPFSGKDVAAASEKPRQQQQQQTQSNNTPKERERT